MSEQIYSLLDYPTSRRGRTKAKSASDIVALEAACDFALTSGFYGKL
jgi:hypothetical protein